MKPFRSSDVAAVFRAYPKAMRKRLMLLRELIFKTAARTNGVGQLEETLKWGEPAYLTIASGSGSTIRIDWKKSEPTQYAMYFHCQTNLVERFRAMFPRELTYEGNRRIVFGEDDRIPVKELSACISMALTYHRSKKPRGR